MARDFNAKCNGRSNWATWKVNMLAKCGYLPSYDDLLGDLFGQYGGDPEDIHDAFVRQAKSMIDEYVREALHIDPEGEVAELYHHLDEIDWDEIFEYETIDFSAHTVTYTYIDGSQKVAHYEGDDPSADIRYDLEDDIADFENSVIEDDEKGGKLIDWDGNVIVEWKIEPWSANFRTEKNEAEEMKKIASPRMGVH